jgi:hypothetical protein
MSACTLFPLLFEAAIPDTLAELMAQVEDELTPKIDAGSTAAYWERNSLRTTCRHLATILGAPIDRVQIEQISLKELLDLIRRHLSSDPKLSAKNLGRRMLRLSQTADQLAESAGKIPETAGIGLVVDGETEFLKHSYEKRLGTTASSLHL